MTYSYSHFFEGGKNALQAAIPLGTGAVSTQTKIVGALPKNARILAIRFYAQAAPTATALTAEVFARTTAGAAGNTLQAAATDIDFATAAAAKTGVDADLVADTADLLLDQDQLIEVVVTADTVSAGPGDLLVAIEYAAR